MIMENVLTALLFHEVCFARTSCISRYRNCELEQGKDVTARCCAIDLPLSLSSNIHEFSKPIARLNFINLPTEKNLRRT